MHANDISIARNANLRARPVQVASWKHLAGFLLIGLVAVGFGLWTQLRPASGAGSGGQLASHGIAIQVYLSAIFLDWALFYYCWGGVHRRGGSLWSLAGGRWKSWRDVGIDVAILVPFWALWEGVAYGTSMLAERLAQAFAGPGAAAQVRSVDSLLPHSMPEVLLWIATCATAGICEELVFRGYLQRQLHALSGKLSVAVVGQGVIFGLFHAYQGWKQVAVISVLGILYGLLAAWRKNLRVNIAAHAFTDIWEGWLKFFFLH